jgi:hypothetical protein
MSAWVVTLMLEVPHDHVCTNDPNTWDWWSMLNEHGPRYIDTDDEIHITVLKVEGISSTN